jgi:hypothetical protein
MVRQADELLVGRRLVGLSSRLIHRSLLDVLNTKAA